ncbi:MAG: hypothetical protein AAFV88_23730, partial [Planctomycetota bacterium]
GKAQHAHDHDNCNATGINQNLHGSRKSKRDELVARLDFAPQNLSSHIRTVQAARRGKNACCRNVEQPPAMFRSANKRIAESQLESQSATYRRRFRLRI